MKTSGVDQTNLDECVQGAQSECIVITRGGKPIALVVGVSGLDEEQLEFGSSDQFWRVIQARRKQSTMPREQLDQELHGR